MPTSIKLATVDLVINIKLCGPHTATIVFSLPSILPTMFRIKLPISGLPGRISGPLPVEGGFAQLA
jgi:hypothetical protein